MNKSWIVRAAWIAAAAAVATVGVGALHYTYTKIKEN